MKFLLDTGSGMSVVDDEALDNVGDIEIPVMGIGGFEDIQLFEADYISVGGAKLKGPTVAIFDLSGFSEIAGVDVRGILGYDFISNFVLTIDYEDGFLSLFDPTDYRYHEDVIFVPIEFVSNIPLIEVAFDEYSGKFVLDTGNGLSAIIHGPFVTENRLLNKYETEDNIVMGGVGGTTEVHPVRVDRLTIGDFELSEPVIYLSGGEDDAFGMTSAIGNIGGKILSRFTLYLDYPNNRIGLVPNGKYDEAFGSRTDG
jgi:hypothetical protein